MKVSDKNTTSLTLCAYEKDSPNSKNGSKPPSRNVNLKEDETIQTKGFITEENTD